jgi:putative sugar O-methyltransferase
MLASSSKSVIQDNDALLNLMLGDSKDFPQVYRPGPYWEKRSISAIRELHKKGLSQFRSASNGAGTSFGDNPVIDVRIISQASFKSRLINFLLTKYPFSNTFNSQVNLTSAYFSDATNVYSDYLTNSKRCHELIEKYTIPEDSVRGGCQTFVEIEGHQISHLYLKLLDTLDRMATMSKITDATSFMEIGPGFGVNIHLMLSNFPRIRKYVYVDIVPNLYVGTQYLKSFYGDSVIDYSVTRSRNAITFSDDDRLEILCITPNQIERLNCKLDFFHNANSFVEMTPAAVMNYVKVVEPIMSENSQMYFVTYDLGDESTQSPKSLLKLFPRNFSESTLETLQPHRFDFHFVSR